MFVLEEVTRIDADRVRCRISREKIPLEFTVRFEQFEAGIRGMYLEGILQSESWELSNRDEFRALQKVLWAYVDGVTLVLPKAIESDWPIIRPPQG